MDRARLAETVGQVAESDPDAVATVIEPLGDLLADPDPDVAASAAWALGVLAGSFGEQVADATDGRVDALVELLEIESPGARVASAGLLAYVGEYRPTAVSGATGALVASLDDDAPEVRASAALALGFSGDERVVPDLLDPVENDPDERVRTTAKVAVERIETRE